MKRLEDLLACPRDGSTVAPDGDDITCEHGHRYPVVEGIPIMLVGDIAPTQAHIFAGTLLAPGRQRVVEPHPARGLHPFVREALVATCGNLYLGIGEQLEEYPIPELRLPPGNGRTVLDVGCNWGRWTNAAADRGYRAVGVDPNIEALLAAQSVCRHRGVRADFVAGDARLLPFRDGAFDAVFSYSVLQHFSPADARSAIAQIGRVTAGGGEVLVQLAHRVGLRNLAVQARRGFREATDFDVRYWSRREMLQTFESVVGPARLEIDGYFGLGIQPSDRRFLPATRRLVIDASEFLRRHLPVTALADSLYVRARRRDD